MAKYYFTHDNGGYVLENEETAFRHVGACSNLSVRMRDASESVEITDISWRKWAPILYETSADDIYITDTAEGYDEDVLTYSALCTYLHSIIVSGGGSGDSVEWGDITGDIDDNTDLANALQGKQDTLTAGTGISINDNVISATGGGGGSQVQADWNQADTSAVDYIKNKPTLRQPATDGTAGQYLKSGGSGNTPTWETLDTTPTESSAKAITSGAVYTALSGKQSTLTFDSSPTNNSTNPVTSGGVYTALDGKQNTLTAGDNISISSDTISATLVQSDWNQSDSTAPDYIKNKPNLNALTVKQNNIEGFVVKSRNVQYEKGKYFSLSKSVGESININSPISNASGYCLVIPITADFQKVVLHSYNTSASIRPWAITNSSGVILAIYDWGSQSAQAMTSTITKEDLPNNSAYIVCDSWEKNTYSDGHYAEVFESYTSRVNRINPLFAKKAVFFGDSIVEGVDNSYTSFADYMADYGCEVYKMGVGGTHLTPSSLSAQSSFNGYSVYHLIHAWCSQSYTVMDATTDYIEESTQYGDRWAHVPEFIKSTSPANFDVIVICAGTNDWNNVGRVLGKWSDTSIPYNYTATVKAIVNELRAVNPNIQVVFVTPSVRWVDYNASSPDATKFSDNSANANSGLWLGDVAGTIIQTAMRVKAVAIDMYKGMGVNEVNFSTFFTSGGTHPNDAGQKRMAKVIAENIGTSLSGGMVTDHVHPNKDVLDGITATAWNAKVGSSTLTGIEGISQDTYDNLSSIDEGTIYFTY
jgi:lysophospholipase L1-like esterase